MDTEELSELKRKKEMKWIVPTYDPIYVCSDVLMCLFKILIAEFRVVLAVGERCACSLNALNSVSNALHRLSFHFEVSPCLLDRFHAKC